MGPMIPLYGLVGQEHLAILLSPIHGMDHLIIGEYFHFIIITMDAELACYIHCCFRWGTFTKVDKDLPNSAQ